MLIHRNLRQIRQIRQITVLLILLSLFAVIAAPITSSANSSDDAGTKKTVRVGWHEPPYFITDENGRSSGYSYEYQRKVAAYTGWDYEYVKGSWSDLMQMLKNGEIDLLSDVSFSEERTEYMLFSSIPMGTEAYYVFVSPDNTEITADNISSLNGKRVGVAKDSIQKQFFIEWEQKYNISTDLIELSMTGEEALGLLGTELDAYVTMDVYGTPKTAVPVCKIGSSDFFFAVSKDRSDLLPELDAALNRIQDENKYYDQQLHDKYLNITETNLYFSSEEKEWLNSHGKIRVGYQDNYLAFCAKDPETGKLTGALKDYLNYASSAFENAKPVFETKAYPTAAAAVAALENGEIDCIFPSNLTDFDAERMHLRISPTIMSTEMDAVVRASEQKKFLQKENFTVAVNEGNVNYEMFLADHYPDCNINYFSDTAEGLKAVADGKADCVLISSYRYSNISKQCEKLHLTTVYTGIDMDFRFAMREGDTVLYSIISRITGVVPHSMINKSLTYYSTEDVKTGFLDLIMDNIFTVAAVIVIVLLIIIILLLRGIKAHKKIIEEENLLHDLNKLVYVDALTSVRNKGAFSDYIEKLQARIDSGEQPKFAVGIFDCNDLKKINDFHGHDKGDIYLQTACRLICKTFEHSAVFRIGGDEFAAVLQNADFENKDSLVKEFEKKRREICSAAQSKWEEVHIAIGITAYDPQQDSTVNECIRRADEIMYENKRKAKAEAKAKSKAKK